MDDWDTYSDAKAEHYRIETEHWDIFSGHYADQGWGIG
jgi:hypothetical protein